MKPDIDESETKNDRYNRLKLLIRDLQNDTSLTFIKNKELLINSLKELDGIIGMKRLKDKVAQQVTLLLYQGKMRTLKGIEYKKKMMSVIMYGPPGTGKSSVGCIYAKILYAMGYLKGKSDEKSNKNEEIKSIQSDTMMINYILILFILGYFLSVTSKHLNRYVVYFIIGIIIALTVYIIYKGLRFNQSSTTSTSTSTRKETEVNPNDLFTVVSRADLIAGYLGQTAIKTTEILEKNRGKVLFIDEAYSLCKDERDFYGKECLDTIVKFLPENPEYVIIFAGYKEDIKESILKVQPGLERRCMFTVETDGYDADELYEIFRRQLKKDGFNTSYDEDIHQLFIENSDVMINYGGDTERLLYYSQLFHSEDNLRKNTVNNKLTSDHVRKAFEELRMNNESSLDRKSESKEIDKIKKKIDINELGKLLQIRQQ